MAVLSTTKATGTSPRAGFTTSVVTLDGLIASIGVRQTFVNSHDEPLEATYLFPLPDRAAVSSFQMEVAGRRIEGQLRERGKQLAETRRAA